MVRRSEKLTFPGSSGELLAARLDLPEGPPQAYALFAHCFTCTKDITAAGEIAGGLARRGIAVLRFDFTGLGHSDGEFANTNFSSNVADLVKAADYLRATHAAPRLLIGHSLGGAAVLAAAAQVPEATAVATIGAPADPAHVMAHFTAARAEIEARGEAEVLLAGRPFRIRRQFLEDIAGHRLEAAVANLRKALILFHAPRDAIVGIDNATRIFTAAKHPKSFISLDDADHLLSRRADAAYVAAVLAAWASRYLATAAEEGAADPAGSSGAGAETAPGQVLVREAGTGRFAQDIVAGRHRLRADEPASVGGDDTGPGPYDLLLAGLGACTAMTLRMYADRKGWTLGRISVALTHEKIHAQDCADCETRQGRVDHIVRRLHIAGELTPEQRSKVLEIADKCPVHRTLTGEIKIDTDLDRTE
ncbi:MAG: alpha/beta fold hydrolase [Alphaproteobacteria bacterium]|nr:MAG: alpha/beta fold hydrolase [Alphaproteobacteria bacterium]